MIDLDDLLTATNGQLVGRAWTHQFTDLAYDSRRLDPIRQQEWGPLFVAVKSDTGDGHDYAVDAIRKGATGVLCQYIPDGLPPDTTCILVPDTRQALLDWARFVLAKYQVEVVAVTGSSGKTVTKEAIAAVLGTRFSVFRNYGSYSGRYGLPIALGQLQPQHHIAVLELAADSVDEIRELAALVRPQVGVVTTINQAHIDTLGSIQAIACEKGRLIEALPARGLAVLNRDDPHVWQMRMLSGARAVGCGFSDEADWTARDIVMTPAGLSCSIAQAGQAGREWPFSSPLFGRHHLYAVLAALAVGEWYGIAPADALEALSGFSPLPGRLHPLPGLSGSTLLDDSYDAELACTLAALLALKDHFPRNRRVAVLGGLGSEVQGTSRQIGTLAAQTVDALVLKGEHTQAIRESALAAGMPAWRIFQTFTNREAAWHLAQSIDQDDVILIKGPREERLEEITHALMMHPDRAPALLVRQEDAFRHVQLTLPQRPTWIEVDLDAIAHNLHLVRDLVGLDVGVMVVLKADGYGHGAVRIARTVLNHGARMLGVACLSEAVALRRASIEAPILILGYTPAWQARETVRNEIRATVFDLETIQAFSRAGRELGHKAQVHVKVDTGMGRLGLLLHEVIPVLSQAGVLPNVEIEGLFTHFSTADESDKTYTYAQLARFRLLLCELEAKGISIPIIHAANSAALLTIPEARFNMVRLGIALYGLAPSQETSLPPGFQPTLAFKTRVAQVKTLPPGSYVSYGNTYQTTGEERIAVIPVGYADGFRRAPAHWGQVLIHGQRAPVVGRVCMDQTMIRVNHIPNVRQGDEVVLIGRQGDAELTVDQVAEQLGTISYEVVSEILARVPRIS